MNNLTIETVESQLVVDSRLVAEHLGVEHKHFVRTIRNHKNTIESAFGCLSSENSDIKQPNGGIRNEFSHYWLNEEQATFAMTLSRNTEQVVQCKVKLVKAFSEAKKKLNQSEFFSEEELIIAWLSDKTLNTKKTYIDTLRDFLNFGGSINATFTTLQKYRESLSQQYKISTANKKLSAIKSLISFAADKGYISQNAAARVQSLKASKDKAKQSKGTIKRILSEDEVKALLDNANSERDRVMIRTAYLLGLRIHEMLSLHWGNFFNSGKQIKVIGKGSKERIVAVPDSLLSDLKSLNTDGFIFQNYLGAKMSPVAAHKFLKKIISKAGLSESISWHWFRHCYASHSFENGDSLESLRQKLGHSSIAGTTLYIHENDLDSDFFLNL